MRLFLIRHAESVGNRKFRLQGRVEFALTKRGRQQAEALADRLARQPLAAVYSSPIKRAVETAGPLARRLSLAVEVEPALQEYDFGELSGLTWPQIRERKPTVVEQLVSDSPEFPRYPGEEGRDRFRARASRAMWEITERHTRDEAVAVVSNAGPITVFLLDVLGRGYRRPTPFTLDNASVTVVEIAEPQPFRPRAALVGLNDTCHLGR